MSRRVVIECIDCGSRYTVDVSYPVGAPHGPKKECHAPSGWTFPKEDER